MRHAESDLVQQSSVAYLSPLHVSQLHILMNPADFSLPQSWPNDSLLNALLASSTSLPDTFSSDSDTSPFYSSPVSSPVSDSELSSEITMLDIFAPPPPQPDSLDAIMAHLIATDTTLGHVPLSGSSLKKRKLNELEVTSFPSVLDTINLRILQGEKLFLSRDQLLLLSSDQFDEYKKILITKHRVSKEEKDTLQKQRKIIKNREYSQSSRQKKKQRVEELETQINGLQTENDHLKQENRTLKQNLQKIVHAYQLQQSSRPLAVPTDNRFMAHELPSPNGVKAEKEVSNSFADFFSINTPSLDRSSTGKATSGVCLFIILLSFGFLFAISDPHLSNGSTGHPSSWKPQRAGRIILSSEESTSWWNNVLSQISETVSALPAPDLLSSDSSFRFITTVTTDVQTQKHQQTQTKPQGSTQTHISDWDTTIECDYVPAAHWSPNHVFRNQTELCK